MADGCSIQRFVFRVGKKYLTIENRNDIVNGKLFGNLTIDAGGYRVKKIYKEGSFTALNDAAKDIKPFLKDIRNSNYKYFEIWDSWKKENIIWKNGKQIRKDSLKFDD